MAENNNSNSQDILTQLRELKYSDEVLEFFKKLEDPKYERDFLSSLDLNTLSLTAEAYGNTKKYELAIISYNQGRLISPSSEEFNFTSPDEFIAGFVKNYILFYEEYKDIFSVEDLGKLHEPLERILNYHELNHNGQELILKQGRDLVIKIKYRIKYLAKKSNESPATKMVNLINNALYSEMSPAEIQAEFANIVEDDIRDIIDKKRKKKDKKKKKDSEKEK